VLDIKPLINRLPVILLGYFAACVAAGAILISANLWAWRQMGNLAAIVWLSLYGFPIYVAALILPVLAVVAITEVLCVRRLMPYLLLGPLGLFLLALYFLGPAILVHDGHVAAIIAGAGIVAGLVYWSIAGRNAGAGRRLSLPK
jgi:hypothetical protein